MNCQECNFHMHVTYITFVMLLCISVSESRQCNNSNVRVVSDCMLYMWLSYVCNLCNWCDINSHEQNIQFWHDSLQEQLEHDFGHKYVFGGEMVFPIIFRLFCAKWFFLLFLVCFVLDLCCYLHNNLAQVYMSCVLTFWHQSMKCILLCFHGKLWYQKGMPINCYVHNTAKPKRFHS